MNANDTIVTLLHDRILSFPILKKSDFIEQLAAGGEHIVFGGSAYETRFAAGLMPDFFFPILSAEDLREKALELIVSRGLAPLPDVSQDCDLT